MATSPAHGDDDVAREFERLVNMTPKRLESWLATKESRAVGIKPSEGREAIGHESGRRIVALLKKHRREYNESDRAQMHRVVGYIKRHLAQRPDGDVSETRWAYSLRNWGHDPTKD